MKFTTPHKKFNSNGEFRGQNMGTKGPQVTHATTRVKNLHWISILVLSSAALSSATSILESFSLELFVESKLKRSVA